MTRHEFKQLEILRTPFSKVRGLMFRTDIKKPLLFIFDKEARKRNSIHSFFCIFPFDAVYMDKNGKVTDLIQNIYPFTINITPKKASKYLIEAKAGFIHKQNIKLDDHINLPIEKKQ